MSIQTSPRQVGRLLALLSLTVIVGGVFAQGFVSNRLIVFTDSAATANNILTHQGLFRLSFTIFMIEMVCNVATSALWYVLLKPVSRPIALVAAFVDLAGAIIKTGARTFYIAPLGLLLASVGDASTAFHGFTPEQLQSIALILLKANGAGTQIAMAFFGISVPLNGYLIFRSGFMPRWLGVLSMIAGIGWLTFIYPPLGSGLFMITAPYGLLIALVMILWLLIRGVDEKRWKEVSSRG
jgi:hypothetical protein